LPPRSVGGWADLDPVRAMLSGRAMVVEQVLDT
jgi:hypothetical protein